MNNPSQLISPPFMEASSSPFIPYPYHPLHLYLAPVLSLIVVLHSPFIVTWYEVAGTVAQGPCIGE